MRQKSWNFKGENAKNLLLLVQRVYNYEFHEIVEFVHFIRSHEKSRIFFFEFLFLQFCKKIIIIAIEKKLK